MNKLIIIGNGFDLRHQVPTGYTDFVTWYLSTLIDAALLEANDNSPLFKVIAHRLGAGENLKKVKSSLDIAKDYISNPINFSSIHFGINNGMYFFVIEAKSQLIEELLSHHNDLKWIDVEAIYYELLKNILSDMSSNHFKRSFIPKIQKLNEELSLIRSLLKQYLRIVSHGVLPEDNFAYIAHDPIPFDMIIDEEARRLILNHLGESVGREIPTGDVMLLNFNYTTLCRGLSYTGLHFNYIDIHGNLGQPDNQLIFGYGDEIDESYLEMEKTNFNDFLTHIKSFGYSQDDNYSRLVQFINTYPFAVYIWGHSCGLSDRTLLNMIFEHNNCTLIKPYYWKRPDGSDNYTETVQNISRHFRDKQKMRNRVANKQFCTHL